MIFFEDRKHSSLLNQKSMKAMEGEVKQAKEAGLSYGQFKANLMPEQRRVVYPVSPTGFVRASEAKSETKALARIK